MQCEEACVHVSALHDGERIPADAAAHIVSCESCRARLRDYAELGAELRLLASTAGDAVHLPANVTAAPPGRWMRAWASPVFVPRYALIPVLAAILALSLGLTYVQAQRRVDAEVQQFHRALARGDVATLAGMLEKNPALVSIRGDTEMLPLSAVAVRYPGNESVDTHMAELLLAAGADVNARTPYSQRTSLHEAAAAGKEGLVILLLNNGADPNVRDWKGLTPLDLALEFGRREIGELLRSRGANPDIASLAALGDTKSIAALLVRNPSLVNARDLEGRPLLEIAALRRNRPLVELLLSYQPQMDVFLAAATGDLPRVREFLAQDRGHVNATNSRACTPLYLAAGAGQIEVAKFLLQQGADINHGCRTVIPGPLEEETPRVWWISPLHAAAAQGDREMILLLVTHGADLRARGGPGWPTPYHLAVMKGHKDLADELLRSR